MTLRRSRLMGSLVVGLVFGFVTWVAIGGDIYPTNSKLFEYLGAVLIILILLGLLAGWAASGNIHVANTWVVALGNVLFYTGAMYLILIIREKRKAKQHDPMPPPPAGGSPEMPG